MSHKSSVILENGCREIRLPLTPFRLEIDGMFVWCWRKLVPPGELVLLKKEQVDMATFRFKFSLPTPANPSDVAIRKVVAKVGDVLFGEYLASPTDTETGWIPDAPPGFAEDSTVSFSLVDFDAKGNPTSGPAIDVVVVDDIGPAVPGSLAVVAKDQVSEPTPA